MGEARDLASDASLVAAVGVMVGIGPRPTITPTQPSPIKGEGLKEATLSIDIPAAAPHGISTATGALGHCARISGEYIASTRVGGRLNLPVPLSRTA